MESTKCNKSAAKKKIEIKTIFDDMRQLIETYWCNHGEKRMNSLKRSIKKICGVMKKIMILKT